MHRIVLDDDGAICCATTQELMLRGGNYASELEPGTSLMPLYAKRDREGYVLVQQNYSGRWQKAHWIAARCGLLGPIPKFEGQRTIIHHRNFDPADNRPENLGFMGDRDHSSFHRSLVDRNEHWQSKEFEARRVAALARKADTPEGHAYFAARGTKNIVRYMAERPEHFRAAVAGNGKRGASVLAKFNTSEKGREQARQRANNMYRCETCGEEVKSYIGLHNHRRGRHGYNHAVAANEACASSELICVAAEHGNFAVAAGVFVRACLPLEASPKSSVAGD